MAYQSTLAIVLRQSDYRENDRIVSLFTQSRGRVEALCRGCRKPKSPLLAASQLFTLGEYVLYRGRGHEMITACQVTDSFYPLREDYDRLSYGALMLAAADMAAQPEEPQEHLLLLLTRSLKRLAYTDMDPRAVTAAYLLHFAALQGYKPRLNHCAVCGRVLEDDEPANLDAQAGGLICRDCPRGSGAMRLEPETLRWLRAVLAVGIDKTGTGTRPAPLPELRRYVEQVLERSLPALPMAELRP